MITAWIPEQENAALVTEVGWGVAIVFRLHGEQWEAAYGIRTGEGQKQSIMSIPDCYRPLPEIIDALNDLRGES